jgi:hypothetical protein
VRVAVAIAHHAAAATIALHLRSTAATARMPATKPIRAWVVRLPDCEVGCLPRSRDLPFVTRELCAYQTAVCRTFRHISDRVAFLGVVIGRHLEIIVDIGCDGDFLVNVVLFDVRFDRQ